jgi:hypothetical protein
VHLTGNGGAPITIDSEEKFRKKYSWSYKDNLIPKLRETYSDFSQNALFYRIKKELEKDINYSAERQLNWNKKNGSKQRFYSPNIMKEFDKHYTKRTS